MSQEQMDDEFGVPAAGPMTDGGMRGHFYQIWNGQDYSDRKLRGILWSPEPIFWDELAPRIVEASKRFAIDRTADDFLFDAPDDLYMELLAGVIPGTIVVESASIDFDIQYWDEPWDRVHINNKSYSLRGV